MNSFKDHRYDKLPEDNINAREGTKEHGWVTMSRGLFVKLLKHEWPVNTFKDIDWGKPDEEGHYTPTLYFEMDILDQKLKETFDDESPAAR